MSQVAKETPGKSLFQVSIRLQQVLAAMGDAQTQINYHFLVEKPLILPIEYSGLRMGSMSWKRTKNMRLCWVKN